MTEKPELPQVEEPQVEEKKVDVDSLVKELERAGVTNAQELSGKLEASQQVGRMAQLLGDERKARAEIEARLKELETRPAPKQTDFMDDYREGQPIDIEAAIARSVNKVFTEREEQQRKVHETNLAKWNFIQSDEDYGLVREIWEGKIKDPNFVYKIQNGVLDPVNEYTKTVRGYYKNLLKQSHDTITTLRGGTTAPPHVETGERTSANLVSESPSESEAVKRRKELKAKVEKGYLPSEEEALDMIGSIFDDVSPIQPPRK
ncbi:MAG: hypothetical protein ACFFCW_00315 [Candidatus Hodarchaeota archaeon]